MAEDRSSTDSQADSKIIVALDYPDALNAMSFVDQVSPASCKLKVGKELYVAAGPELVRTLVSRGFDVFLDLKFHDIPNTVAKAVGVAADLGVWMTDVHASGGRAMMEAARQALDSRNSDMLLIGVTVLTSMSAGDLAEIGVSGSTDQQVSRLATLAQQSGLDGVVCSAQEASGLRDMHGADFTLVTPGIRPSGSIEDDQTRVMTPMDAVRSGSDYLVIGRPITQSADPLQALTAINAELESDSALS